MYISCIHWTKVKQQLPLRHLLDNYLIGDIILRPALFYSTLHGHLETACFVMHSRSLSGGAINNSLTVTVMANSHRPTRRDKAVMSRRVG